MADGEVFIADYITKRRFRNGKAHYFVKWKGCPSRLNTWEPEENILDQGLILDFESRLVEKFSKSKKPGRKPKLLKLKSLQHPDALSRRLSSSPNCATDRDVIPPECDQEDITAHRKREPYPVYNRFLSQPAVPTYDVNHNVTSEYARQEKWKVPRKPKSLFLEQSLRETSGGDFTPSIPSADSYFGKVYSPVSGSVPSPTANIHCEVDGAKTENSIHPPPCSVGNISSDNPYSKVDLDKNPIHENANQNKKTEGNSVKLGKFALLRKYRNSLEEREQVTTTDVTVEGVTIKVRESFNPDGFFKPKEAQVWWC